MEQIPEIGVEVDEDGDPIPRPKSDKKRVMKHLKMSRASVRSKRQREKNKKVRDKLVEVSKLVDNKVNVVDASIAEFATEYYPEALVEKKVVWEPFPGPQTQFLQADEFEVLFSGGRAPGKSDALLMDPLRWCHHTKFRGLVIRKAMQDLRDLIKRAKLLYPMAYPGAKWKEQEKLFVFPSGATIEFGYCDHEDDVARYQGQEYTWLGIDELTQIEKEETYEKLVASVRTTVPELQTYVRATTNPNGPGKVWVKARFIDKGPENKTIGLVTKIEGFGEIRTTRKWIHGTVFDNPIYVKNNLKYIAMLQNLSNAVLRKQWLEGDWDSADGLAFDEFERKTHVIEPFTIPSSWKKFRACDWGYKTKAVCLWMATDYDGNIYVYRELTTTKVLAGDFAVQVRDLEKDEVIQYGILDVSAWSMRGENSPPPAEEMILKGVNWRPSDRTGHSRITGKLQVHKYLQKDPETKKPKLFIFNTCTDVIACLASLPINKNNPEDVKTDGDDHAYDALRYGLMSRPLKNLEYDWQKPVIEQTVIINNQFGY